MLLKDIPGFEEAMARAAAQEAALRDVPWLCAEIEICGVPIRQLTPTHLLLLTAGRSPFVTSGIPSVEHVAQFLWILSPEFVASDIAKRDAFFTLICGQVDFDQACAEISEYIDLAFMDRPSSGGPSAPAITSFVASLVHTFAWYYGWPAEVTMRTPMAGLFQLRRLIDREVDPKISFVNRLSDRERRRLWKEFKAAKKAEAEKTTSDTKGRKS